MIKNKKQGGFTLIEILVVIGLIAILAAVVLIAINPARQFAQGRNSQRTSNVNAILNAIGQNMVDNKGIFTCAVTGGTIDGTLRTIKKGTTATDSNIRSCLVTLYMSELPYDPSTGSNTCTTATCAGAGEDYDTKYTVQQDTTTKRITVCAPESLNETAIPTVTNICVTR